MKDYKLYSWGANSHGQLSLGYESEMCTTPQIISIKDETFKLEEIHKMSSGGGGHILFLNNAGILFACGWNNKGQLGFGYASQNENILNIKQISMNPFDGHSPVVNIATGWECSAALTQTGSIFVWGSNINQQLGISKNQCKFQVEPLQINLPLNEKCKQINFGLSFTCFLTDSSVVYFVGKAKWLSEKNEFLKIVHHNNVEYFKLINFPEIEKICCAQNYVAFVTKSKNEIKIFGDEKYCKTPSIYTDLSMKPEFIGEICDIQSGWTHTAILNSSGEIFLWGRNIYGQCGGKMMDKIIEIPTKLSTITDKILSIHLGAEHGLVVTEFGDIFTWGWNEHGNCGNNSEENVFVPTNIPIPGRCIKATCGAGFCYALICHENYDENNKQESP